MKIIHTSVLLPVLLGGCSLSHQQPTDVDARQFVEGQISIQIQRIAEAQKSLQQASGTIKLNVPSQRKQRASVTTSKASSGQSPTLAPTSSTLLAGLPTIKLLGTPKAAEVKPPRVLTAGSIVGVPPRAQTELGKPTQSSSSVTTPTKALSASTSFSKLQVNKEKNLIASPPSKPLITSPAPTVIPAPKVWRIEAGSTLKDTLFNWAATEKCIAPGITTWTVAWQTPVNYRIDAPLQFKGDFLTALNSLFTLYGSAKVPLYAGTRSAQCVVSVDDKEPQ